MLNESIKSILVSAEVYCVKMRCFGGSGRDWESFGVPGGELGSVRDYSED